MIIKTSVKSGGVKFNHGVKVRTGVKSGGSSLNHGVKVRA
jgi:hypothetical protein